MYDKIPPEGYHKKFGSFFCRILNLECTTFALLVNSEKNAENISEIPGKYFNP
jgi:hypothetical protein